LIFENFLNQDKEQPCSEESNQRKAMGTDHNHQDILNLCGLINLSQSFKTSVEVDDFTHLIWDAKSFDWYTESSNFFLPLESFPEKGKGGLSLYSTSLQ